MAIEPALQSLAVLAGIVLIRTFLSLSLEVEIEGRWRGNSGAKADSYAGRPYSYISGSGDPG